MNADLQKIVNEALSVSLIMLEMAQLHMQSEDAAMGPGDRDT